MTENKQQIFMEALESLKEYAKVNGSVICKADVLDYFKEIDLDEAKLNMVYGYLLANSIKVEGDVMADSSFMDELISDSDSVQEVSLVTEEEYEADEKYVKKYMEELNAIEPLSELTKAMLLVNIAEDNDKTSLRIITEAMLPDIVEWVKPFRKRGVLASDLIQEANLTMMDYMGEKRFLNNYEWKEKLKEGSMDDIVCVLHELEAVVKKEIEEQVTIMIAEQAESDKTCNKVLAKVNKVNDWVIRLKEELERKPTVDEVAEKMGISRENVLEAIKLSAENIEDIDLK